MSSAPISLPVNGSPIKFGTDGWRGVIAADFTFERVVRVAAIAAQILEEVYGPSTGSRTIIVGFDRRFMAETFAQAAAESIQSVGFDVMLSETYAPTPAFSWLAHQRKALGAIVLTASHNPAAYLGLKVKGSFGGSVPPEVTQRIEAQLAKENPLKSASPSPGKLETFNIWPSYCEMLRSMVDIARIKEAIAQGQLTVFVDAMHGSGATGLGKILEVPVQEINSDRDPLFDGGAPEPLPRYLSSLFRQMRTHRRSANPGLSVGFVFDGDADRIAAVDGDGTFLSSQILIPVLIEHLAKRRGFMGAVIKTVSGSDLIPRVAKLYDRPLMETAIGFKYIADRMLENRVLIGGEESGGIGYGTHVPERDALLSSLYLLEAIVQSGLELGTLYRRAQEQADYHFSYDRIDLPLSSMAVADRLREQLKTTTLTEIAGQSVVDCLTIDGYKFRLSDGSWLLIRFSGTEPVLRLYCEAATLAQVRDTLAWAKQWAEGV